MKDYSINIDEDKAKKEALKMKNNIYQIKDCLNRFYDLQATHSSNSLFQNEDKEEVLDFCKDILLRIERLIDICDLYKSREDEIVFVLTEATK